MKSETINKLSIPFGIFIGPATVASNMYKVIKDIGRLAHAIFQTWKYQPSKEALAKLARYETTNDEYQKNYGPDSGYVRNPDPNEIDPEELDDMTRRSDYDDYLRAFPNKKIYEDALDTRSKIWNEKLPKHFSKIGIGIIRTIPLFGGIGLTLRDRCKKA